MVCLQRKPAHFPPLCEAFYCVLDILYLLTLLPLLMSVGCAANSLTRAEILFFLFIYSVTNDLRSQMIQSQTSTVWDEGVFLWWLTQNMLAMVPVAQP